jgi:hypothetical protein
LGKRTGSDGAQATRGPGHRYYLSGEITSDGHARAP